MPLHRFYHILLTLTVTVLVDNKCRSARCHGSGSLRGDKGAFFSPDFPKNYPNGVDCVYHIIVPRGHRVKLGVTFFDVESCTNCGCDFLEIRDGPNQKSPLVGRFCDPTAVNTFYSSRRHMWIRFKTDKRANYQGFSAVYVAKKRKRGRKKTAIQHIPNSAPRGGFQVPDVVTLNRTKGVFTSPNFPRHYDNNVHKLWRLQVNSGSCIKLSFDNFELHQCSDSANCECDYIRIGEGKNISVATHGQFCSRSKLSVFTSQGPLMWVEFTSDSNSTSTGFQAIFEKTACVETSESPQDKGKLQLLTAVMCSFLLVLFMVLLCLVPRAVMKYRHHRETTRKKHKIRYHTNPRHCKSKNYKHHHQHHYHHHHRPHEYSKKITKDLGEKSDKPMNCYKEKRTNQDCKCHCQCSAPPLTKKDRCCDRYSISSVPISQCSLISLSSTT